MQVYSIKEVELLSGIKAHTLRIWEQRYQISISKRRESNQRYYDAEDLKHLLRLAYLCRNGEKISNLSKFNHDEIRQMSIDRLVLDSPENQQISRLTEAMMDFDEELFEAILDKSIAEFGFFNTIMNVVYPFFERVGVLWVTDVVAPVQEHFSSNIIRRKMLAAIDRLNVVVKPMMPHHYLLFTPEGEHHELPLLFIYYLLKRSGHRVVYAGASVPADAVWQMCQAQPITHVWMHAITALSAGGSVGDYVDSLASILKKQKLLVSGPLFSKLTDLHSHVRMLNSMDELIAATQEDNWGKS